MGLRRNYYIYFCLPWEKYNKIGRSIKLTDSGETFLGYANKIIHLVNESKEVVKNESIPTGTLKIVAIELFCTFKLPKILDKYHEKYSNVNIELKVGICSNLREMLRKNT